MLSFEAHGEAYSKAEINRELRDGLLAVGTKASIEYWKQNISSVGDDEDRTRSPVTSQQRTWRGEVGSIHHARHVPNTSPNYDTLGVLAAHPGVIL